jgi:multidrug efflux pump
VAQRIRPVLLTAIVTAGGVIPMALNIEFDFIRREIVVGGLSGSWFTHLSAALVSGLLFSTLLTLVMVPVMITAPSVVGAWLRRFFKRRKPEPEMPTPEVELPPQVEPMRTAAE